MTLEFDSFESDANVEHFCLVGPGGVGAAVSRSPFRLGRDGQEPAQTRGFWRDQTKKSPN